MKPYRFAVAVALVFCFHAWAANPPQMPTDQELQQMLEKGDYRACLQQTARVLTLKGPAAAQYDLYTLQMRRGECLINLNDAQTALAAYTAALNAADTQAKAEPARATIALIRGSRGGNYTPASGGAPIGIIPLDARKRAMAAAFQDALASTNQQFQNAIASNSLTPILNYFPKIQDLHALEVMGTGSETKTHPMLLAMGERARALITSELRIVGANINAIQGRANQMLASGNSTVSINGQAWWVADTRSGLSADDRDKLRNTQDYLNQILTTCQHGKLAAQSFGSDGAAWEPLISACTEELGLAGNVLGAE